MKLNAILKNFRKTLTQLDAYIAQVDREIEQKEEKMAVLQSETFSCRRDLQKASSTRDKIADLIGAEV